MTNAEIRTQTNFGSFLIFMLLSIITVGIYAAWWQWHRIESTRLAAMSINAKLDSSKEQPQPAVSGDPRK